MGKYSVESVSRSFSNSYNNGKLAPSQDISVQRMDWGSTKNNEVASRYLSMANSQGRIQGKLVQGADNTGKIKTKNVGINRDEFFDENGKLKGNATIYLPLTDDGIIIEANGKKVFFTSKQLGVTVDTETTKLRESLAQMEKDYNSRSKEWQASLEGQVAKENLEAVYKSYYDSYSYYLAGETETPKYKGS
jgi:hypothetical protein